MRRSDLHNLLPDFSEGQKRSRSAPARVPGFEPLVQEAFTREEFTTLDMPSGFAGFGTIDDLGDDPFADFGGPALGGEPGDNPELSGLRLETQPDIEAGIPDLSVDYDGEPLPVLSTIADGIEIELSEPEAASFDEIESEAEGVPAHELLEAAHSAEIDRLEAAHRLAFETLIGQAIPKMKQEIVDTIAAELAPLVAPRIRSGVVAEVLQALAAEISTVLEDSAAVSLELRGPESLLLAFGQQWDEEAVKLKLVPDEGVDLVARVDRSVIATRLSDLDRLLGEALS